MKTIVQLPMLLLCVATLLFIAGCNDEANKDSGGADDHGHSHEEGADHSHEDGDHSQEGHAHAPGPHGGAITDWGGGKFHVEFTVDHDKQEATAYVYGTDEKTPSPIAAEEITLTIKEPSFTTSLKAAPQENDPEGKATRFVGTHESLGKVQEFEGSMSALVEGTPYSGNFHEEAHDH